VQSTQVKPQELWGAEDLVAVNVGDRCDDLTGHYKVGKNSAHTTVERLGVSWTNRNMQLKDFPPMNAFNMQLNSHDKEAAKDFKKDAQPEMPEDLDLREKGLVTPVKDQGTCGSCWAFGATGAIEGQYAKASGNLTVLADQQFVDCTWSAGNLGCDGGNDFAALSWVMEKNKGKFQPESEYGHYASQDGFCHLQNRFGMIYAQITEPTDLFEQASNGVDKSKSVVACSHVVAKLQEPTLQAVQRDPVLLNNLPRDMPEMSMIDMLKLVLMVHGPASVSIQATHNDFYYYASGVYNDPECSPYDSDHVVLLTGYGTERTMKLDYWLLKNSWSTYWGEDGYIRTARKGNVCGVATDPVIVHLG